MTDPGFTLFDEFAARFARGESPDVRAYLERAGDAKDELAELIDAFLARAEPSDPDEEAVAVMRAFVDDRPPLLELRTRRGIRVDEVITTLLARLKIDPRQGGKVKDYYQQLEGGLLDARRVDRRVWDALAVPLGDKVRDVALWRPRMATPRTAFARGMLADEGAFAGVSRMRQVTPERDEVDVLFLGE